MIIIDHAFINHRIFLMQFGCLSRPLLFHAKPKTPVYCCSPLHIKKFESSIGKLANTNKLDAKLIAYNNEAIKPEPSILKLKHLENQ
jgi:hypothetical protein